MRRVIFVLLLLVIGAYVSAQSAPCTVVNVSNTTGSFAINGYQCLTVVTNSTQNVTVSGVITSAGIVKNLNWGENFTNSTFGVSCNSPPTINQTIILSYGGPFLTPTLNYTNPALGLSVFAPNYGEWRLSSPINVTPGTCNTSIHPLHPSFAVCANPSSFCTPAPSCPAPVTCSNATNVTTVTAACSEVVTVGVNEQKTACVNATIKGPQIAPQIRKINCGEEFNAASMGFPFLFQAGATGASTPALTATNQTLPSASNATSGLIPTAIPATGAATVGPQNPQAAANNDTSNTLLFFAFVIAVGFLGARLIKKAPYIKPPESESTTAGGQEKW